MSSSDSESDLEHGGDNNDKSLSLECLEQQVFELELLQSMFSPKELCFTDCLSPSVLRSIHNSASQNKRDLDKLSPEFQIIKECIGQNEVVSLVELTIQFSPLYPIRRKPNAFVRCDKLTTVQLTLLNKSLRDFILTIDIGSPCVMEMITWLDSHFVDFTDKQSIDEDKSNKKAFVDDLFGRWFIYSHHIYSKFKRKDILAYAVEKHLTGFSCPGKPGIICIEGCDSACQQFWDILRTWTWKKIAIRHKDNYEMSSGESIDSLRKFTDFKEIGSEIRSGKHLDGGALRTFLLDKELNADEIFRQLFGINHKDD